VFIFDFVSVTVLSVKTYLIAYKERIVKNLMQQVATHATLKHARVEQLEMFGKNGEKEKRKKSGGKRFTTFMDMIRLPYIRRHPS
jgi:hypothetical protein